MTAALFGARPIVSLKSDAKLEKVSDTEYKLVDNENPTWSTSETVTVTIRDNESGLKCYWEDYEDYMGIAGMYKWSQSEVLHPSETIGWTPFQINNFEDGTKEVSFEVTISDITGIYYLWINKADGMVSDMAGNTDLSDKRSDPYYLDNTAPTVSATVNNNNMTIIMSDSGSGTTSQEGKYYLSTLSNRLLGGSWATYTSGTPISISQEGGYYLFVETVADSAGYISTQYGTLTTIDGNNYHRFGPFTFTGDKTAPIITIGNGITAETLTADDYGGYVTNYTPTNGVNDEGTKWRIFHSDGENIYLIADSYVLTEYIDTYPSPKFTEGYYLDFVNNTVHENYYGTSLIEDEIATKWLKKYKEAGYAETNRSVSGGATQYFLEPHVWRGFKDETGYADYAVGAPTLELFAESYNSTVQSPTIETKVNEKGYYLKWSNEGDFWNSWITNLDDTKDELYIISESPDDQILGMYLASPAASAYDTASLFTTDDYDGIYDLNIISGKAGCRPVICLNSDVQLEKISDTEYQIVEKGDKTWSTSHTEIVTITDEENGLAQGIKFQYGWSTSREIEPSSWDERNIIFDDAYQPGQKSISYKVVQPELTGKYYLWVKPITVKDTMGNAQTENKISENQYWFDNTSPTVSVSGTANELLITVTDSGSGLSSQEGKYYLSTSSTELVGSEWKTYTSGVSIKPKMNGTFYVFVEQVSDNIDLISTQYGTLTTIDGNNYHRFGPYTFENDITAPKITLGNTQTVTEPLNAETLSTTDYGGYVTNYESKNGASINWRIFHTDGENIYLIAEDYVETQYWPAGKGGNTYSSTSGQYAANLNAYQDYVGTEDIEPNLKAKWLSQYSSYTSTFENARATAYLLDTSVWSSFTDDDGYAEYGIGGPTIEMFVASYNATHPDRTIKTQANETGYDIAWNDGEFGSYRIEEIDRNNTLYRINNTYGDTVEVMNLASPGGTNHLRVMDVTSFATIESNAYTYNKSGIRPVVALRADAELEKQQDGSYEIVKEGGNKTWSKTHTETITISDESAGLATGAKLKYGWSTSSSIEPNEWTDISITNYSEGANTASVKVSKGQLTGKYYLWIKPVNLVDTLGNSQTENKISALYYFDNMAPNITIGEMVMDAETLSSDDYGGYVTNYASINETTNGAGIDWRIFHTDGKHIYLIADNYVPIKYWPTGKNGTTYSTTSGVYGADLNAATNYSGISDISSDIKNSLLSKYIAANNFDNGKATAYLLDSSAWANFKDSNGHAAYSIGGPTIELFVDSYNKTHPNNTLKTQVGTYGYNVALNNGSFNTSGNNTILEGLDRTDSLYFTPAITGETVTAIKLASPAYVNTGRILTASIWGSINTTVNTSAEAGIRPIVVLNENVQIEKQVDGTYRIVEESATFTEEDTIWQTSHSEIVTITDEHAGLAAGMKVQYGWSESKEVEPSTWTTVTLTDYSAGDRQTTLSLTEETLTGEYYLWVKPVTMADIAGNSQTQNKKTNDKYAFDNTLPTITTYKGEKDITITMTDAGSGLETVEGNYYISTSSTELVNGEWKTYTSGTAIQIKKNGTFYVFVETINDKVGNTSTQYGTLKTINETKYHMFGPYEYIVDLTAPTIKIGTGNESSNGITAAQIYAMTDAEKTAIYGKYVTNYVASNASNTDLGIGGWRIFHADSSNIYLIADDYVNRNYVPTGRGTDGQGLNGTAVGTGGKARGVSLEPYADYDGTANVASNIASKWLKQYTDAGYTATSTNINAKTTAYLLDTTMWSGFKDSTGYAEYSIGGPTLELFRDSYNVTHDTDIETRVTAYGYQLRWKTEDNSNSYVNYITGLSTSESLYVITSMTNASGMWIASPSANYNSSVMLVNWQRQREQLPL